MDWGLVLKESILIGLVTSAVLTVLVIVSLLINKEMWLQDYPPDVKAKWGPMSERSKRMRNVLILPFFGALIAGAAATVLRLGVALGGTPPFLAIFVGIVIVFVTFNLVDALIIDWLILMVLWPGLGVLPGTEGMAGYRDMRLWTANLLKGFLFAPLAGLLVAGIAQLVFWIEALAL
jgi:hypothetical protein